MYADDNIVAAAEELSAQLIGTLGILLVQMVLRYLFAYAVACAIELGGIFISQHMTPTDKLRPCFGQEIKRIYYVASASHFFKIFAYRGSRAVMSAAGVTA